MSTYIIHNGYCIEYGTFIMGLFFRYLNPSIWVCFETPYSHIPVSIVKMRYASPPPPHGEANGALRGLYPPSMVLKNTTQKVKEGHTSFLNHFSMSKDWQSSAPKICTLRGLPFEPKSNQTLPWLGCSSCPHKPTQPQ